MAGYENYYKWGLYSKVRKDRYDSKSERAVCYILNHIMKKYALDEIMQLRLTPQQALDIYIEPDQNDDKFTDYYKNKHKWMKFDFIFEEVYEYNYRVNYVPVCVIEFDGPYHDREEQKQRDYYKNGVAVNIGAEIVRIKYDSLEKLNEKELCEMYEEEILNAIIKGYFTKSVNFRKEGPLINDSNIKKFNLIFSKYESKAKYTKDDDLRLRYNRMLQLLYIAKERGRVSGN